MMVRPAVPHARASAAARSARSTVDPPAARYAGTSSSR